MGLPSLEREESFTKTARAVEARKAVDSVQSEIHAAALKQPDRNGMGEDFWDALVDWIDGTLRALAFADVEKTFAPGREPTY